MVSGFRVFGVSGCSIGTLGIYGKGCQGFGFGDVRL